MDATYISSSSFYVVTDRTDEFVEDRRIRSDCGGDGIKYCTVSGSSYSDPNTTVVTKESELTSNLTAVLYGIVEPGVYGSLPDHSHDGSEGSGDGTAAGSAMIFAADAAAQMALLSGQATATFDFNSQSVTGVASLVSSRLYIANDGYIGSSSAGTTFQISATGTVGCGRASTAGVQFYAQADNAQDTIITAIYGLNFSDGATNTAVQGSALGELGTTNIGVRGRAENATSNYAFRSETGEGDCHFSNNVNIVSHNAATVGLKLSGTLVTASATEINQLDGNAFTSKISIQNLTINTTAPYMGLANKHFKTAGATDEADDFYGIYNDMQMNDGDSTIGSLRGIWNRASLVAGTIGDGQEDIVALTNTARVVAGTANNDILAVSNVCDIDSGTIAGDIYGIRTAVDIDATVTSIGGDVYGHYIVMDVDKDPVGSVYMIYLEEASGIDYGIYQNGTAPNYFGGDVGIGGIPETTLGLEYSGSVNFQLYRSNDGDGGSMKWRQTITGGAAPYNKLYFQGYATEWITAAILEADGSVDINIHDASSKGLKLGGTLVTSSATEINQLDGNAFTNVATFTKSQNGDTLCQISNVNVGVSARAGLQLTSDAGHAHVLITGENYTGVPDWAESLVVGTDASVDGGVVLYSSDKVRIQNSPGVNALIAYGGRVGIGGYPGNDKLRVVYAPSDDSAAYAISVEYDPTITVSGTYYYQGLLMTVNHQGVAGQKNLGYCRGIYTTIFGGVGDLASLAGLGTSFGHYSGDTGTTDDAYGLSITPYHMAGTITNSYSLYIASAVVGGTVTNEWGIYQADDAPNYFGGNLEIESSSDIHLTLSKAASTAGMDFWTEVGSGMSYIDNDWDSSSGKTYFRMRGQGAPVNVMVLQADGNVGIGVDPLAWHSAYTVIDIGSGAGHSLGSYDNNNIQLHDNWYFDGTWKAARTGDYIAYLSVAGDDGSIILGTSADVQTAGEAATGVTTRVLIDKDGNVDICSHDAATVGLKLGGTLITASAAEINQLDGNAFTAAATAADHGAAATDEIINVCYGTGDPPAADTTTEGTLFVKYVA